MTNETQQIRCAACNEALEGPAEAKPHDRFVCPVCGEGDTFENVLADVRQYAKEQIAQHLSDSLGKTVRGSQHVKVASKLVPKHSHRFVINLEMV